MSTTSSGSNAPNKRRATAAGLETKDGKATKRRASKACQCCRARKVRCDVVEHGLPCTNCRLDEVDCLVTESKRRKKLSTQVSDNPANLPNLSESDYDVAFRTDILSERKDQDDTLQGISPSSPLTSSFGAVSTGDYSQHVPHLIYQSQSPRLEFHERAQRSSFDDNIVHGAHARPLPAASNRPSHDITSLATPDRALPLPAYIKPLSSRVSAQDEDFLAKKGALSIPAAELRDALLRSYLEYVQTYMPILELHDFLNTVDANGAKGTVSLLLLQAIMFAGSAFVDISLLRAFGFESRKAARRDFFSKTKLLYDFDYEVDQITLVQSLLLMTYWYETPDDQKDTWHWLGVAVSLAQTMGLHRNTEGLQMTTREKRRWKRVWWSCFIRDRLITIGMRKTTRVWDEDHDVPMLTLDDFEIEALSDKNSCIPLNCVLARDVALQRKLALLCIEKARLALCISNVLCTQYSALVNNGQGSSRNDGHTATTTLQPLKRSSVEPHEIQACDRQLRQWSLELPLEWSNPIWTPEDRDYGPSLLKVHLALLHLIYHATISALYRPQMLPCVSADWNRHAQNHNQSSHCISWQRLHTAASEITRIAKYLHEQDLERFLPSTGVIVLCSAIVTHLLDMKASGDEVSETILLGFRQCMQVMQRLCEIHAAAYVATQLLQTAVPKAGIKIASRIVDLEGLLIAGQQQQRRISAQHYSSTTPPPESVSHQYHTLTSSFSPPAISQSIPEAFLPSSTAAHHMISTPSTSAHSSSSTLNSLSYSTSTQNLAPSLVSYPYPSRTSYEGLDELNFPPNHVFAANGDAFDALMNLEIDGADNSDANLTMRLATSEGVWPAPTPNWEVMMTKKSGPYFPSTSTVSVDVGWAE